MADNEHINPFFTLMEFIFLILVVLIFAFMASTFLNVLPNPNGYNNTIYSPLHLLYAGTFGFFDSSFIFIYIFIIFMDLVYAWFNPKVYNALANILLLFVLAYFSIFIKVGLVAYNNALTFNSLLPQTYAFFSNDYWIVITFFALIISIIFNSRRKEKNEVAP